MSIKDKEIEYKKRRRHRTHRKRTFYRQVGKGDRESTPAKPSKSENQIVANNTQEMPNMGIKFDLKNDNPLLRKQASELLQWILNRVQTDPKDVS